MHYNISGEWGKMAFGEGSRGQKGESRPKIKFLKGRVCIYGERPTEQYVYMYYVYNRKKNSEDKIHIIYHICIYPTTHTYL